MKELIGMNLISYAIAFIIIFLSDLSTKDKIIGMLATVVFVATISIGAYLLVGI